MNEHWLRSLLTLSILTTLLLSAGCATSGGNAGRNENAGIASTAPTPSPTNTPPAVKPDCSSTDVKKKRADIENFVTEYIDANTKLKEQRDGVTGHTANFKHQFVIVDTGKAQTIHLLMGGTLSGHDGAKNNFDSFSDILSMMF